MKRGNLTVLQAEVIGFDVAARRVLLDAGQSLAYDHLIVAAGATHSYFGHDEWASHAPGLKTLADAFDDPLARDRRVRARRAPAPTRRSASRG